MKIFNLTPFPCGYLACSRRPPVPEMTCIVRAKYQFEPGKPLAPAGMDRYLPEYITDAERRELGDELDRLAQGSLTAEGYEEGDDARTGQLLYPGDFAEFKPCAEVMLRGSCYPPKTNKKECIVRVRVGEWTKELRVVGPRAWVDKLAGGKMTDPMAFTRMPVDYAHAHGGPEHPLNPVGMGHSGANIQRVPCVEPIRKQGELAEPAGFGPINPLWPQRANKRGSKYGEEYQRTRAPYYAEDFDWHSFNAAPASQQLLGYLRGDEEVVCDHLHPDAVRIKAQLPGLRIRAFTRSLEGKMQPVSVVLDTVFIDLEQGLLYLTWRGLVQVAEIDLTDRDALLVVAELLKDEPKPDDHYLDMLEKLADDPIGLSKLYGDDLEAAQDLVDEGPDIAEELAKLQPDQRQQFLDEKLSVFGPVAASVGALAGRALRDVGPEQLGNRNARAGEALAKLKEELAHARQALVNEGQDTAQVDGLLMQIDKSEEQLAEVGAVLGPDEPAPNADCRGQDLSGRDLSGCDLRGIQLQHANLSKAKLAGAQLAGADLSGAVLYRADLSEADLSAANLTRSDLTLAVAIKTNFAGATLNSTVFRRTFCDGASFVKCQGLGTDFSKAELTGIDATEASFEHAQFIKCKLSEASFAKSSLLRCALRDCNAEGLLLTGARVEGWSIDGSQFKNSDLTHITGERTIWRNAVIDGSDLRFAKLPAALFQSTSAAGANFDAAVLRSITFYRANLRAATFRQADLFGADFRHASVDKARFSGANLYDAKFMEAAGTAVDFGGAMMKRANFERCKVVRI